MKMKMVIPILAVLAIGSTTYTVQAITITNNGGNHVDSYNTKHFFDKEKEINQGKNIIIKE